MHYYQFNLGDYYAHTSHLSPIEDLAYRRLIDKYYLNEQPFNGRSTDVARKLGLVEHSQSVDWVLNEFFVQDAEGNWQHERINQDIASYKTKIDAAKRAGEASAKSRKNKSLEQPLNDRSTVAEPPFNQPITNNQEPITNNQLKEKDQSEAFPVAEIFLYWVKVMGKPANQTALSPKRKKVILDRLKDGYSMADIKSAIDNCRQDPFSMGQNDRGKPFNDIELICRSPEKLESFMTPPKKISSIGIGFDLINSADFSDIPE